MRSATARFALALALIASTAALAFAGTIVVDVGGSGDYTTIQAGVDAANEGDVVLVFPGTYADEGNRDIVFGEKNITLQSRDGAATTILRNNDAGTEHRIFYFNDTGQDTSCVIDGFTIRGGNLYGLGAGNGGGISINGLYNPPSPKFTNLIITGNYAPQGGGVYVNSPGGGCNPVFRNCHFDGNIANLAGGAFYCGNDGMPLIADCTFQDNNAQNQTGAGLFLSIGSDATINRCWFEGNGAGEAGGAVSIYRASPEVTNTVFHYNVASGTSRDGYGGAISCRSFCSPTFTNCTLVENSAAGEGGSIYVWEGCTPTFENTIIANTLPFGGSRGAAVASDGSGCATFDLCCVYSNAGGDDLCGTVIDSIVANPMFCGLGSDDFTVDHASPCLPDNNPGGELIGAYGEGCNDSPVEETTWGAIKARYR